MIRREEVKTYRQRLICTDCGDEMKPTGVALMSSPPQYQHACSKGHLKVMSETYPNIIYVPANNLLGDELEEHH